MTNPHRLIYWVKLSAKHTQIWVPRFRLSKLSSPPAAMHIESKPSASEVRLVYKDSTGQVIAVGEHSSLDGAVGAAELEFGVTPREWRSAAISRVT